MGFSFKPLRWSRIWTSTRRVDSVPMLSICSTTPVKTKLSSPAASVTPRQHSTMDEGLLLQYILYCKLRS